MAPGKTKLSKVLVFTPGNEQSRLGGVKVEAIEAPESGNQWEDRKPIGHQWESWKKTNPKREMEKIFQHIANFSWLHNWPQLATVVSRIAALGTQDTSCRPFLDPDPGKPSRIHGVIEDETIEGNMRDAIRSNSCGEIAW